MSSRLLLAALAAITLLLAIAPTSAQICGAAPPLDPVVKTAILVVCDATVGVLAANPMFDPACNHAATPATISTFLFGVDMYVNKMREQKMPLRDRTNVTMEYTYINIGTIDWRAPDWTAVAVGFSGPSMASGITTDGLMWDILMTSAYGGPYTFVMPPMLIDLGATILIANICEDTDACMMLHPFASAPNIVTCMATQLLPMPADCIRRQRLSGTRRFNNLLGVLFDSTTVAMSALDTYHTLGAKTVYIIAESAAYAPFPGAALARTIEFAKQLNLKLLNYTVLELCKTDTSNCPKDAKGQLFSPLQTQILPGGQTNKEFAAKLKELNPDALIMITSSTGRSQYTFATLFDGFKAVGWTPKMVNWAGGGDAGLRPFMSDYNDLLYGWTTAPWDYRLTGPQYKNVLTDSNFELFPAAGELDGPAIFAQEYNKRYGALFPGGKFEFSNSGTIVTAIGYQALTFGQKLIESALSAAIPALVMASLKVSTPSIYHQLEFDSYGRTTRVNEMLLMLRPAATPSSTTAHSLMLFAPYNIGETPVYPLPTWSERTFNPVQYDLPLEKMMAAITAICLAVCLVIAGFVVRHARHSVIRAATPSFCLLTVLGAVLMLISNFFHTTVASDSHCGAQVWLLSFGFTLLFSSLFVKTFRIWKIFFGAKKLVIVKMKDSHMMMAIAGFLLVDIVINAAWAGSVGMQSKLVVVDPIRPSYNYLTCDYDDSMGFVYAHLAIKCGLLLFGICLTWLVRNTPSQFNESVFIAVSLYNVSFIIAFVVPILSADLGGRNTTYLIRAFAIMFVCTATILLLYVPKLISIYGAVQLGENRNTVMEDDNSSGTTATGLDKKSGGEKFGPIGGSNPSASGASGASGASKQPSQVARIKTGVAPNGGKDSPVPGPRNNTMFLASDRNVGVGTPTQADTPKGPPKGHSNDVREEGVSENLSGGGGGSDNSSIASVHPAPAAGVVVTPQLSIRVDSSVEMQTLSDVANKYAQDMPGVVESDEETREA